MARNVFIIGMLNSVHLARWLAQFVDQDIDFTLIPSTPTRSIHPIITQLRTRTKTNTMSITIWHPFLLTSPFVWALDRLFQDRLRGFALNRFINKNAPEIIHALEFQHAGYLLLAAERRNSELAPKIIITNYGSDIFWFKKSKSHRKKITKLLKVATHYSAECLRDVHLAEELGFKGSVLPVIPNAGGFDRELLLRTKKAPAERSQILVKGYHGWAGLAKNALDALCIIENEIKNFEIIVYSANKNTIRHIKKISKRQKLAVQVHAKGSLSHEQMLALMGNSRIYIGISKTDGISTSLLEAIAMGAFPVQTSSSCCDEWFSNGVNGISVEEVAPISIAKDIKKALLLSSKFSSEDWKQLNYPILKKLDSLEIKPKAFEFYSESKNEPA